MHALQIVTNSVVEKGMEDKGSFDRTMMQALEQLWLAKGTSWDEAALISEKIKLVAIAITTLSSYTCVKASVSQSVCPSVSQSVNQQKIPLKNSKFYITPVKRFMVEQCSTNLLLCF